MTDRTSSSALALSRRSLFQLGIVGGALAAAPLAAKYPLGFTHGVASGEPGPDGVLLWSRFAAGQPVTLQWEVAEDEGFSRVVAGGSALASPDNDWCVKPRASGLSADRWYYFRFIAPSGATSCTGSTRTLPVGAVEQFRMAVVGCSNKLFGWFNAYAHIAEHGDFDLVLHTGDYLYEYPVGTYPTASEALAGRAIDPLHEIVALADYRARYASYRSDPDLQRLHQLYPMLHVSDDHESANDAYALGAENHDPATEGTWEARKRAAIRARAEWMPVSDAAWASYDIGNLATLFRLETRLTARTKPFDLGEIAKRGGGDPGRTLSALEAFRDGEWREPSRTLMGAEQESWLAEGFKASRGAGKKWQVLLQQVVMASLKGAPEIAEGMTAAVPDYLRKRIMAGALNARVGLPFNMDAWDGYPAARERLLRAAQEADANLVVLAGDSHNAWASELSNANTGAGVEFAGHSVSSPGFESYLSWIKPQDLAAQTVRANPQLKWAETASRGYMAVELSPARVTSEYRFLQGVRNRSTQLAGTQRLSTAVGSHRLEIG
ncbi:alkaline phosphatase D family protein [Parerythrobacter lacustris]|uniref:Alkaline phosphatase D family protein n=1 Tax=Parerythrobacter lacustris TaxID=2969984 RepID=A0ABT1XMF9_9SPHN|nr:alkaline phosphatase D family protein [Parerythrobacter lacustris]MCR2832432.1 alkaline phosphatase D family protein [Parerythrobacter lacustris]